MSRFTDETLKEAGLHDGNSGHLACGKVLNERFLFSNSHLGFFCKVIPASAVYRLSPDSPR